MTGANGPYNLADVALETLADYVELNFCTVLNQNTPEEKLPSKISPIQKKCEELKRFVRSSSLPPSLANEVSRKLFKMVDSKIWEAGYLRRESWHIETVRRLVVALIHPTLSKLELEPKRFHNFFDYGFIFIISSIYPELQNLQRLRVLQLEYPYFQSDKTHICNGFPQYLEELTVRGFFSDDDLKLAVETCKGLKYVNISISENITDESVEHILKIDKLLSLDVVGTCISDVGIVNLLEGLAKKEEGRRREAKTSWFQ